jgi:hypothetical protein
VAGPGGKPKHVANTSKSRHHLVPLLNGNWTNAQLQEALRAHKHGYFVNGTATLFDIPRFSFYAHLAGTLLSWMRKAITIFTQAKGQQLVEYIIAMQDLG